MERNINTRIKHILDNFLDKLKKARELKDKKVSVLIEKAEDEYVKKIEENINL